MGFAYIQPKNLMRLMDKKSPDQLIWAFHILERERRLELPTPTLARLCSTN